MNFLQYLLSQVKSTDTMLIFTTAQGLSEHLNKLDTDIAFAPTMGALHDGHLSLIALGQKLGMTTVSSIFVNPTQFNNPEDLAKYPRTIATDIEKLEGAKCDVLFLPTVEDMYPDGTELQQSYELGSPASVLEGTFRPGHFQGVAQIVDRLLDIVHPAKLILGQKDLQQIAIITAMVKTHHPQTEIVIAPTLRDDDGLAKSSRNQRLNIAERSLAPIIYQTLISIQAKQDITSFGIIQKEATDFLKRKGLEVEYLSLINSNTWEELKDFDKKVPMAVLIAAYLGKVRLIDNILL